MCSYNLQAYTKKWLRTLLFSDEKIQFKASPRSRGEVYKRGKILSRLQHTIQNRPTADEVSFLNFEFRLAVC